MKSLKAFKPQILQLLLLASSLNELLLSLKLICRNLDLEKVNNRARHFRELRFTFFGLTVKANGILDRMLLQAEFMRQGNKELAETRAGLEKLKKGLGNAFDLVQNGNLRDAARQILETAEEYEKEFKKVAPLAGQLL